MKAGQRQAGLTLIELLVALALTAVLGVMLAALVNGWLKVRERLQANQHEASVLDFCLALERRFDSPVLRQLYEQRLPLATRWLDWQADRQQLRTLVRNAQAEKAKNKPPRAYREIYQVLRALMLPAALGLKARAEDADPIETDEADED